MTRRIFTGRVIDRPSMLTIGSFGGFDFSLGIQWFQLCHPESIRKAWAWLDHCYKDWANEQSQLR